MQDLLFIDFTGENDLSALLAQIEKKPSRRAEGIVVVSGPGRFSAVRSAVLAGNLLSELLDLPAVGIIKKEGESADELRAMGRRALPRARSKPAKIMPFYGSEPNITKSKNAHQR